MIRFKSIVHMLFIIYCVKNKKARRTLRRAYHSVVLVDYENLIVKYTTLPTYLVRSHQRLVY